MDKIDITIRMLMASLRPGLILNCSWVAGQRGSISFNNWGIVVYIRPDTPPGCVKKTPKLGQTLEFLRDFPYNYY